MTTTMIMMTFTIDEEYEFFFNSRIFTTFKMASQEFSIYDVYYTCPMVCRNPWSIVQGDVSDLMLYYYYYYYYYYYIIIIIIIIYNLSHGL